MSSTRSGRPDGLRVLLLSTYDLGRQPFGLASPAAWLEEEGCTVTCMDLAVQGLEETAVAEAELIGLFLPMHTATILGARLLPRLRRLNPAAHLCCYGLYAPLNEAYLRSLGVSTILGGEFESGLASLARRLARGAADRSQVEPRVSLERQHFRVPQRSSLPALARYARLQRGGNLEVVGSTQASRGCRHLCRHCPVVPVYSGRFRVVEAGVVVEDVRRQAAAGAQHITFGDPDFFNAPAHALSVLEELHRELPALTYDVTIKVQHLLEHRALLPRLRAAGCILVTTAVESLDDGLLDLLDKHHTRDDFHVAARLLRSAELAMNPTFIPFTPWTTRRDYQELLETVQELDLVDNVAPIQYAIRLLITAASGLLELPEVRDLAGSLDPSTLTHPWHHPDPEMDRLHSDVLQVVEAASREGASRGQIFRRLQRRAGLQVDPQLQAVLPRAAVPFLTEPWYC